jgi:hypothetical protein
VYLHPIGPVFFPLSVIDMASIRHTSIIQPQQNDKVKLVIHHQFPGIELTSPVYVSRYATCHLSPSQSVHFGSTTQVGFKIDSSRSHSFGVLIYKLEKKNVSHQATNTRLVIIWHVNETRGFRLVSYLEAYDQSHIWDKYRLKRLAEHSKVYSIQHDPIEERWLMYDHTVLMTRVNTTCEEACYKLEMTISEASINEDTRRPLYIDPFR